MTQKECKRQGSCMRCGTDSHARNEENETPYYGGEAYFGYETDDE